MCAVTPLPNANPLNLLSKIVKNKFNGVKWGEADVRYDNKLMIQYFLFVYSNRCQIDSIEDIENLKHKLQPYGREILVHVVKKVL